MSTGDLPTIMNYSHTHNALAYNAIPPHPFVNTGVGWVDHAGINRDFKQAVQGMNEYDLKAIAKDTQYRELMKPQPKKEIQMTGRRLVQVFVADPDEMVPLENCLLYTGEMKITDSTDQELFYEIDVKAMLDKHNAFRKTIVDKDVKDRTEYLEPVKIRDLKMVVVTAAEL